MRRYAVEEGRRHGLIESESLMEYGTQESLFTPEMWDYEERLDAWRDRIFAKGFDPDAVLSETRGIEREPDLSAAEASDVEKENFDPCG
jgi:hypothetical protein